jgi:hypothetical protein
MFYTSLSWFSYYEKKIQTVNATNSTNINKTIISHLNWSHWTWIIQNIEHYFDLIIYIFRILERKMETKLGQKLSMYLKVVVLHLSEKLWVRLRQSTNQKQELPVVAMFVNGSGQTVQSLERTFYRCFLPSFSSFGWWVSEEKIKMWKVNGRQTMDAMW